MNKFIIKSTIKKGKGLFTTVPLGKNEVLFRFEGKKLTLEEALKFPDNVSERFLQVGSELYVDLGTHYSVFANHDCNPNCYIKIAVNTAFMLTTRAIKADEELTFDYSLTSTETPDMWSMACNCSPFKCRKIISGFQTLPENQKQKLIEAGMVPKYAAK
jgi:hypothetical protein